MHLIVDLSYTIDIHFEYNKYRPVVCLISHNY